MRRENRVAAIQFLYQWSLNQGDDLDGDIRYFFEQQEKTRDHYAFAEELIYGVIEHLDSIDTVIREYTKNWEFNRISKIDLSILRLAIYEMNYRRDIPPVVSINEAIDLSKVFSVPDAKRFINGILDEFKKTLNRPLRQADL